MKMVLVQMINSIDNPVALKAVKLCSAVLFWSLFIKISNSVIRGALKRVSKSLHNIEAKKQIDTVQTVILSVINTVVVSIMLFEFLNIIGIDIRPFLAAAGVVGVAIGFGAKSFVEDIISGLLILLSGQIRVGDYVKIDDSQGIVEKINIRMVVLRDLSGAVHYIKNGLISKVINYTCGYSYALFDIEVAYKENIDQVIKVLKDLGDEIKNKKEFQRKIKAPIEIFGLDKFTSSSVVIKCRIKTLPAAQWEVYRTFNLMVKNKFDELGIEIPFTQVTVHQAEN